MKKTKSLVIVLIAAFLVSSFPLPKPAIAQAAKFSIASEAVLVNSSPTTSRECYNYVGIGSLSSTSRYIARLDLSNAPAASSVTKAVFRIKRLDNYDDSDNNYLLYRATSSWSKNLVSWSEQPAYASSGVKGQRDDDHYFNFDVTAMVKDWINDPASNYGFMIRKEDETKLRGMFVCSTLQEDSDMKAWVPVLEISTGYNTSTTVDATTAAGGQSVNTAVSSNNPVQSDAFKAIVKIKKFSLDEDYFLSYDSYGSGVIINNSGLVLTNSHVIETKDSFDNSDKDTSYEVCLPSNTTDEPDCSYIGKLVAKDKDLDIALLQIENIPGMSSRSSYPSLALSQTDNTKVNDEVTAIGYPSIGGSSVTVTRGIVSGKSEKYGKKWIKTDAVTSFGSSGGAAIDASGQVIGITSAGHSDLLGSLGYVIDIASVSGWIEKNRGLAPKNSQLKSRVAAFAKAEKALEKSDQFENPVPNFTLTKPSDWKFEYLGENTLYVNKPEDEEGGYIITQVRRFPYLVNADNIVNRIKLKSLENGNLSFLNIQTNENVKVGGLAAKKMVVSNTDGNSSFYAIPYRNYIIYLDYYYGLDDKDKETIDRMINSFRLKADKSVFSELKKYSNAELKFSLSVSGNWSILTKDQKDAPLEIYNKKYKDLVVKVSLTKIDDNSKRWSNEELLKQYKDLIDKTNKVSALIDMKVEITGTNAHYRAGKNFSDTIKVISTVKSASNGKPMVYKASVSKKIGSKYILDVVMITTNPDQKAFNNYQKEFFKLLQNFSLK